MPRASFMQGKLVYGYIDTHVAHKHILKSNLHGEKADQHRETESKQILEYALPNLLLWKRTPTLVLYHFFPA